VKPQHIARKGSPQNLQRWHGDKLGATIAAVIVIVMGLSWRRLTSPQARQFRIEGGVTLPSLVSNATARQTRRRRGVLTPCTRTTTRTALRCAAAAPASPSQAFLSNGEYTSRTDVAFTRTLGSDAAKAKYRRRRGEAKTVVHWGQRKLLLSEIEFLLLHGDPAAAVVYAGAAPGTHFSKLSELFPEMMFFLYDPAPFTVKATPHIFLHQQMYTDDVAAYWAQRRHIFISDIRSCDPQLQDENETDEQVKNDMAAQQCWTLTQRPVAAMLKFRPSWRPGATAYLDGAIYLPIWGPITTTEARLIVAAGWGERSYDNTAYEEQMFFFNTSTRVCRYPHDVVGEGVDHCYDCTAEVHVLSKYFQWRRTPAREIPTAVAALSRSISRSLSADRTLASPNADPGERRDGIRSRQWINGKPAYQTGNVKPRDAADEEEGVAKWGGGSHAAARADVRISDSAIKIFEKYSGAGAVGECSGGVGPRPWENLRPSFDKSGLGAEGALLTSASAADLFLIEPRGQVEVKRAG
jgi:hypothetical protein